MTTWILLAVGGGLGAGLRHVVAVGVSNRPPWFPLGITSVNVLGSFLLGVLVGAETASIAGLHIDSVTVGVLGGFTTFSTWMVDIDDQQHVRESAIGAIVPLTLGVAAAALGVMLGVSVS